MGSTSNPWSVGFRVALQEDARQRQPAAPDLGDLEKLRRRSDRLRAQVFHGRAHLVGPGLLGRGPDGDDQAVLLDALKVLVREGERHFSPPAVEQLAVVADSHHQHLKTCGVLSRRVHFEVQIARIDEHQRSRRTRPGPGVVARTRT